MLQATTDVVTVLKHSSHFDLYVHSSHCKAATTSCAVHGLHWTLQLYASNHLQQTNKSNHIVAKQGGRPNSPAPKVHFTHDCQLTCSKYACALPRQWACGSLLIVISQRLEWALYFSLPLPWLISPVAQLMASRLGLRVSWGGDCSLAHWSQDPLPDTPTHILHTSLFWPVFPQQKPSWYGLFSNFIPLGYQLCYVFHQKGSKFYTEGRVNGATISRVVDPRMGVRSRGPTEMTHYCYLK